MKEAPGALSLHSPSGEEPSPDSADALSVPEGPSLYSTNAPYKPDTLPQSSQTQEELETAFDTWLLEDEEDVWEQLEVPGRGVVWRSLMLAAAFLMGLVLWLSIFAPPEPQFNIEAMAGLEQQTWHRIPEQPKPELEDNTAPEGWAASISEEANFSGDAQPLAPARPGDWLYHFPEQGQTYKQYAIQAWNRRSEERNMIYVAPMGALRKSSRPVLNMTARFLDVYYDTPTRILPTVPLPIKAYSPERGQYDARIVLEELKSYVPHNAVGLVVITEQDLFIPSVNYVFGLGSFQHRVAAVSAFRFGDDKRINGERKTVLRRTLTAAVHEFGHVISMRHCTAFRCIMNGTNSLEEADQHPLHLCPVCTRKAQHGMGFHRQDRYARLLDFYDQYGFEEESTFIARRLDPPTVEFLPEKDAPLPAPKTSPFLQPSWSAPQPLPPERASAPIAPQEDFQAFLQHTEHNAHNHSADQPCAHEH